MLNVDLSSVTQAVTLAIQDVRTALNSNASTEGVLDPLWCLQDRVHQLAAHIHDYPSDLLELNYTHPRLTAQIVGLLNGAPKFQIVKVAAVERACDAINESLLEIQRFKDAVRAQTASNGT